MLFAVGALGQAPPERYSPLADEALGINAGEVVGDLLSNVGVFTSALHRTNLVITDEVGFRVGYFHVVVFRKNPAFPWTTGWAMLSASSHHGLTSRHDTLIFYFPDASVGVGSVSVVVVVPSSLGTIVRHPLSAMAMARAPRIRTSVVLRVNFIFRLG